MLEILNLEPPCGDRRTGRDHIGEDRPRARVAIGTFDGVHLGHREVLDGCDTVLTFDPHPMRVLDPRRAPGLLSDRSRKLHRLGTAGIRRVAVVPFDRAWSRVSAEDFIECVVLDQLNAAFVSVGHGFRFGAEGTGTTASFGRYPELGVRVVPLVTLHPAGEVVSSTRIRRLVLDGDVEAAAGLLGAHLVLPAVADGTGRLLIDDTFVRPAPGLYLGYVDACPQTLRVGEDSDVTFAGGARPGSRVEITFVKRMVQAGLT
ncbi:riboflavin kinase/FMN adenylyltransferase [Mycobacterium tuberculosis]|nr:riboflavin kinase/FMN adenylyltransferase [Mycobacterium tuberculosis]